MGNKQLYNRVDYSMENIQKYQIEYVLIDKKSLSGKFICSFKFIDNDEEYIKVLPIEEINKIYKINNKKPPKCYWIYLIELFLNNTTDLT